MAMMGTETGGYPVVLPSGGDSGFGGMGGIGSLLIGALLFGGGLGRGGFGGWGGAGFGGGAPAVATGVELGQLNGIQAQISSLQTQATVAPITQELESIEDSINSMNIANLQGFGLTNTAISQANYTNLVNSNTIASTITAQNNQNALAALNSANQLNTTILQGFNGAAMQANVIGQNLVAGQTAMAAQMATCCCEIKQSINADGDATRALINNLYVQNLQGQLSDAKTVNITLANSLAQNAQTAAIISALKPPFPVFPPVVV